MTEVLAWGTNKFGQLGDGTATDRLDPVALDAFRGTKIVQVCAGPHHSLAVAELGDVFVWGRASEGQWGNGQRGPSLPQDGAAATVAASADSGEPAGRRSAAAAATPQRIWALRNERIVEVAAGNFHSLAVTKEGRLYEWGRLYRYETSSDGDEDGQQRFGGAINLPGEWARTLLQRSQRAYYAAGTELSEADVAESDHLTNFGAFRPFICAVPRLVPGLERTAVRSVAAGYSFNVAVAVDGRCFSWGYNSSFQLGLGDRFNRASPCRVTFPHGEDGQEPRIVRAACGEQHTLFLSRNGAVYSCGLGVFGQLGHGFKRDERRPRAVSAFAQQGVHVVAVSCGAHHSAAVDSDGHAWAWGHAEYAQMAGSAAHRDWQGGERGTGSAFTLPQRLEFFRSELSPPRRVVAVACGDLFTVALTDGHELYGWGWNSSGALGTGSRRFCHVPTAVARLHGERVECISAGGVHTLALNNTEAATFAYDFGAYAGSARFADVRFVVQNVDVPAHMIVVRLRCPRLAAAVNLSRRYAPASRCQRQLPLPGVKLHVFRALLNYLYTDRVRCTPHWLPELGQLADRLRLPHLAYLCARQQIDPALLPDFDGRVKRVPSTFVDDMRHGIDESQYADVLFGVPDIDDDDDDDDDTQPLVTTSSAQQSPCVFHGHRVVLAARCAYLKRLFDSSGFKDSGAPAAHINFEGVGRAAMRTLLAYMYTADQSSLDDPDMLAPVLMLSDRFLLSELKQVCEDQLEQLINEENVGTMLILADRYNAPRLRRACLNLLQRRWAELVHSPAMHDIRTNAPDLVEVVCHYAVHAPKLFELDSASAASSST